LLTVALIPELYVDSVVAIGIGDDASDREWIASGFFFGVPTGEIFPDGQPSYTVWLVTNRHVIEGHNHIYVRADPVAATPPQDYLFGVEHGDRLFWAGHPDDAVDIAATPVNFSLLQAAGMQVHFFESDNHVIRAHEMAAAGVTEGDSLFVLGYPMGMVGSHRSVVTVRSGTLARVRDTLMGAEKTFLVDATVFPGNSGGPVVTKPEVVAIPGTTPVADARLIGVVRSYVSYTDYAISPQTGRTRATFEENAGLAEVHPVEYIEQTVAAAAAAAAAAAEELGETSTADVTRVAAAEDSNA
jgi:hypothetical protein